MLCKSYCFSFFDHLQLVQNCTRKVWNVFRNCSHFSSFQVKHAYVLAAVRTNTYRSSYCPTYFKHFAPMVVFTLALGVTCHPHKPHSREGMLWQCILYGTYLFIYIVQFVHITCFETVCCGVIDLCRTAFHCKILIGEHLQTLYVNSWYMSKKRVLAASHTFA